MLSLMSYPVVADATRPAAFASVAATSGVRRAPYPLAIVSFGVVVVMIAIDLASLWLRRGILNIAAHA